jgi:CRISPR system Cascade subunit CasB
MSPAASSTAVPYDADKPQLSHPDAADAIAGRLAPIEGDLSTGDRAELRRISPHTPFTPTLWKLLLDYGVEDPPAWWNPSSDDREDEWGKRWATLVMGMAHCAGLHERGNSYDRGEKFGETLYETGWAEDRLVRLLETPPERLHEPLRRLAQYLSSKSQVADWTAVARLLLDTEEYAEKTRLAIARGFYRAQYEDEEAQSD